MSTSDVWGREADVVVVGTGAAGMAAAVTAAHEGATVIVLEKAGWIGGTTAKSGGGIWIPNNSFMRAAGIEDPKDDCIRYMARLSYPPLYDPTSPTFGLPQPAYDLIEAFYDNASVAVDLFMELGAMPLEMGDTPSYSADLP